MNSMKSTRNVSPNTTPFEKIQDATSSLFDIQLLPYLILLQNQQDGVILLHQIRPLTLLRTYHLHFSSTKPKENPVIGER